MGDEVEHGVPGSIVDRLRCPQCGLSMVDAGTSGVRCENGHEVSFRHGYLDCSDTASSMGTTDRTFASFGFEWNAFDQVQAEDEAFGRIYFRDLDLDSLRGQVGLDAGCGKGRFTRILAAHLESEVALDGSSAVEAAARNLADLDNVTVVKADLRHAPFAAESFDFISSLGVLHHLDDPRDGFRRLVTYLAPGGRMLLYLYSRPPSLGVRSLGLSLAAALRTVTVRLSHPVLKALSTPIAGLLYAVVVVPGRWGERNGVTAASRLPMDTYRDKPFRSLVLDTFDRLSAPVEHRYVWADLEGWFSEAGLVVEAARDETGWFVLARRP